MKKIRGKSLQEWKEYGESDNVPINTMKYIIVLEEQIAAISVTRCSLKLKDDIDEFSELTRTFIKEVDKKNPSVNLPEEEDFYLARHKLVDKLNDL